MPVLRGLSEMEVDFLDEHSTAYKLMLEELDLAVGEIHSFRVCFYIFSTRLECISTSSPLVSSVVSHLPHSFRV